MITRLDRPGVTPRTTINSFRNVMKSTYGENIFEKGEMHKQPFCRHHKFFFKSETSENVSASYHVYIDHIQKWFP